MPVVDAREVVRHVGVEARGVARDPCRRASRAATAASRTLRVNVPTVSSDEANAISPYRLIRPYVGFSPTTPQSDAGCRTEPPVSVPERPHDLARRDRRGATRRC